MKKVLYILIVLVSTLACTHMIAGDKKLPHKNKDFRGKVHWIEEGGRITFYDEHGNEIFVRDVRRLLLDTVLYFEKRYRFDENDRLTEAVMNGDSQAITCKYRNGKLIERFRADRFSDSVLDKRIFKYHDTVCYAYDIGKGGAETLKGMSVFDKMGHEVLQIWYLNGKVKIRETAKYKGKVVDSTYDMFATDSPNVLTEHKRYTWQYDPQGNVSERCDYGMHDSLEHKFVMRYKYNTRNDIIWKEERDMLERHFYLLRTTNDDYDEKGILLSESVADSFREGVVNIEQVVYSNFDDSGNYRKKTTIFGRHENGRVLKPNSLVIFREIEYYH